MAAEQPQSPFRIIKPGKRPEPVFRGTCLQCGCIFEADKAVLNVQHDPRNGDAMAKVDCPECGNKTWMYPYTSAGATIAGPSD